MKPMAEYNRVIKERRKQTLMILIVITCWIVAGYI